eukprot:31529-Pelagococcus_subviridis.AAC.26
MIRSRDRASRFALESSARRAFRRRVRAKGFRFVQRPRGKERDGRRTGDFPECFGVLARPRSVLPRAYRDRSDVAFALGTCPRGFRSVPAIATRRRRARGVAVARAGRPTSTFERYLFTYSRSGQTRGIDIANHDTSSV